MKKYILMTIGFTQPTDDIMAKWMEWFQSIGDKIVEQVGLMNGHEVINNEIIELPFAENAITGYLVINAKDINEALEIAKKCPAVTSTRVYEVRDN